MLVENFNSTNQTSPFYLAHESFVTFFSTYDCVQVNELEWAQKCEFTRKTPDCRIEERILDYTSFIFCGSFPQMEWIAKAILVNECLLLFFSVW